MTRRTVEHALLIARTTRNLRPSQVVHRARLRVQRFPPSRPVVSSVIDLLPAKRPSAVGWPDAFNPIDLRLGEGFPSPEDNAEGRFRFLNQPSDLGWPIRWDAPGMSRLWKYHLHYFDWAWSFASHPERAWARDAFGQLWRSWEASTRFGAGHEWHPYVASLRAWALCGTYRALAEGSGVQADVVASLARHARFLRWHTEHDVGGNHLLKNLKALIGLAVFLGDEDLLTRATGELTRQLAVQLLSDGGHYERSPSYHCQVLGDLIDVAGLLDAAGCPPVAGLASAIEAMRTWLGLMLMPDGDVPLFNDCVLVGPSRLSLLEPGPPPAGRLTVLPASGYVIVRPDERLHLVADVGDPCPKDLPAHAHADCLSFQLAVDGEPLVVDSGTSTYEPGARRAHERSTAAHNTVSVDGADQTEVWGTFRAARLARASLEQADDDGRAITVTASHDGYRRLAGGPVHRRTWIVSPSRLTVADEILGRGRHRIESRLHLAPEGAVRVVCSGPPGLDTKEDSATYAEGFGVLRHGLVVSAAWQGEIPVTMQTELRFDEALLASSAGSIPSAETVKGTA